MTSNDAQPQRTPADPRASGERPDLEQPHANGANGLTAKQERALEALLAGRTQAEAGRLAHASRSTLARWVNHDGPFRRALLAGRERRRKVIQRATEDAVREEVGLHARARRLAWEETVAQLEGLARKRIEKPEEWEAHPLAAVKLGELAIKLHEMSTGAKSEEERKRLESLSPEERAQEFRRTLRAVFGRDTEAPAASPPPTPEIRSA